MSVSHARTRETEKKMRDLVLVSKHSVHVATQNIQRNVFMNKNSTVMVHKSEGDMFRRRSAYHLTSFCIPELARLIERAGHHSVTEGIIESNGIDNISVTLERVQFFACIRVPHLARPVVAPGNEFVAHLVKRTIRQWKDVCAEHLEEAELIAWWRSKFVDEFLHKCTDSLSPLLRDERLLPHQMIDGHVHVRLRCECEQIHALLEGLLASKIIDARHL